MSEEAIIEFINRGWPKEPTEKWVLRTEKHPMFNKLIHPKLCLSHEDCVHQVADLVPVRIKPSICEIYGENSEGRDTPSEELEASKDSPMFLRSLKGALNLAPEGAWSNFIFKTWKNFQEVSKDYVHQVVDLVPVKIQPKELETAKGAIPPTPDPIEALGSPTYEPPIDFRNALICDLLRIVESVRSEVNVKQMESIVKRDFAQIGACEILSRVLSGMYGEMVDRIEVFTKQDACVADPQKRNY